MNKVVSGKWTGEQLEAINTRGCNLLVSAAAGAGKTAVLVERVLGRIMDRRNPVDIDRLLVVTFTNAAAAEMRERIGSAIASELRERAGDRRLGLQLALLDRAWITTIHSFCMDILKRHFDRIDLDPDFRVADEIQSAMLKAEVLEELLEAEYSGARSGGRFLQLAECYGGELDDAGLMQLVIKTYDYSRSNPDPAGWLRKMAGKFASSPGSDSAGALVAGVLADIARFLGDVLAELEGALDLCSRPGGPAPYASGLREDIALVQGLLESCQKGWDEAHRRFGEVRFAGLKRAGPGVDETLKDRVAAIRNRAKEKIKAVGDTFLSRPLAEHVADMERLAPVMGALAEIVAGFAESYRLAKVSRGLVDFSDLEHYCLQILAGGDREGGTKPSAVALELQEHFEEVLVDEYQDINPVQEAIINLVSRPPDRRPNLFLVGDVKQSIYRFRLADPTLFLEKYRNYAGPGGAGRLVNLSRNFRSRREIVDAVNYVFRRIMAGGAAELEYGPEAELVYGAGAYGGPEEGVCTDPRVELHILERSRPNPGDLEQTWGEVEAVEWPGDFSGEASDSGEEPDAVRAEARLVARRIRQIIDGGLKVYDGSLNGFRPATYRDVVVLLRSARGKAGIFADEMKSLDIPACAEQDTGYFQAAEIKTMVSLLKLLDNPRQDIPLAAVLRSPLVGLGCEELARVRMARRTGELWDAVVAAARRAGGDLSGKLAKFISSLNRWRELSRRATMTDLIWTVYRETGYYHYVGAMPGGAQRQANLRALHHWAGQFEATAFRGIYNFLRFIDRMRESGEDPGRARMLGENENVVRIMSIHRSKGLEFPVVVVSGLGGKFNLQDLSGEVLLHREAGLGPLLIDPEARTAYPTLAWLAVRERLRREMLAEEMRILYVAMTRAREKLVLTGTLAASRRFSGLRPDDTGSAAAAPDVLGTGSCLDWICQSLAGHTADMGPHRGTAADGGYGRDEKFNWLISISKTGDLAETAGEAGGRLPSGGVLDRIRRGEKIEGPGKYTEQVRQRLSWTYPAREAAGKPAKISVTGLGESAGTVPAAQEEEGESAFSLPGRGPALHHLKPVYARPVFLAGRRRLTAAEAGSAVHSVMRHLDLGGRVDPAGIAEQVNRIRERELITGDQADAVDCGKIAEFFRSELGRRVLAAGSVKRELPFSLLVRAEELYPDLEGRCSGERVLVQGVIDCLADEGDGYLLIDFKTDRLTGAGPAGDRARRYKNQMEWYARAVETLTGRRVKERYLYFFEPGIALRV